MTSYILAAKVVLTSRYPVACHGEFYFKAENLVLRARSESFGFAEIVNKDRMVGTKAQRHRVKTKDCP